MLSTDRGGAGPVDGLRRTSFCRQSAGVAPGNPLEATDRPSGVTVPPAVPMSVAVSVGYRGASGRATGHQSRRGPDAPAGRTARSGQVHLRPRRRVRAELLGRQNFKLRVTVDMEGRTFISKVGYVDLVGKTLRRGGKSWSCGAPLFPGLNFDLTWWNRARSSYMWWRMFRIRALYGQPVERASTCSHVPAGFRERVQRRISIRHATQHCPRWTASLQILREIRSSTRI